MDIPLQHSCTKEKPFKAKTSLSQRQHSLFDLRMNQAGFALLNASLNSTSLQIGKARIDARLGPFNKHFSLARAKLGILTWWEETLTCPPPDPFILPDHAIEFFFIFFFPHDGRNSLATTEAITLLQRTGKLCAVTVGSPKLIPPEATHRCYLLLRHPRSFCFITAPSIKGPQLKLWPVVWWTRNPYIL